ncbi:TRAP transporter substrate-binding protein [Pseudomonas sp. JDS28PS106]|uniref:TRAP transporter substrate-binding protein n=1 Tax=Pseudomonas sp. JDS28PS106 TaxID=2497235 RepID=UPI002FD63B73
MLESRRFTLSLNKIALALVVSSACAAPAMAETRLTLVSVWPEANFHVKNLRTFAEEVKKVTQGEVVIDVHSGGDLGMKGPELLASVRDGIVDMADLLMSQQVGEEPLMGLQGLPYLVRNADEQAAMGKVAGPYYAKIAERNNQKFLYTVPWPGQGLYTKTPVLTQADLNGLKIRTVEKNGTDFFGALKASPIQMPWGEVIPALASGALDGVTTSSTSGVDGKFWEFTGFFNQMNWQSAPDVVSINLDIWNDLSAAHQQAIADAAQRLQPQFEEVSQQEDRQAEALLLSKGLKISRPTAAFNDELSQAATPIWKAFIEQAGPDAQVVIKAYLSQTGRAALIE